jgi:hypothetical protein
MRPAGADGLTERKDAPHFVYIGNYLGLTRLLKTEHDRAHEPKQLLLSGVSLHEDRTKTTC